MFTRANGSAVELNEGNAGRIFSGASLPSGVTAERFAKYLLGDTTLETSKLLKKRKSLLGTVVNSGAIIFKDNNQKQYIAFAANDGALHILDSENGHEVLGYIPQNILSSLSVAYDPNQTGHVYLNDGVVQIAEVGNNKTMLIGSTGRGGKAIYGIDVTDLSHPSTGNIKWEFTDADLGYTISEPVAFKAKDGKTYLAVSSGYNSGTNNGYLYILDAEDGTQVKKLFLGAENVGSPFAFDVDDDGFADRIYIGDDSGKLWRIDIGDSIANALVWKSKALFEGESRPISAAPFVQKVKGKTYVVFATGRYLSTADTDVNQQNYAYGIIDDNATDTIQASDLLVQNIQKTVVATAVNENNENLSYRTVTDHPMTTGKKGWKLTLLKGQLIASRPNIRKKKVAEFTAVDFKDLDGTAGLSCEINGSTYFISVDLRNGGLYNQVPVFDTNNDGNFDDRDTKSAMVQIKGKITPNSRVIDTTSKTDSLIVIDTSGNPSTIKIHSLAENRKAAMLYRVSFKELE